MRWVGAVLGGSETRAAVPGGRGYASLCSPASVPAVRSRAVWGRQGDWLSGRALRSHRRGRWFEPSIAHQLRVWHQPRSEALSDRPRPTWRMGSSSLLGGIWEITFGRVSQRGWSSRPQSGASSSSSSREPRGQRGVRRDALDASAARGSEGAIRSGWRPGGDWDAGPG